MRRTTALHLLHLIVPHRPWRFYPDGTMYPEGLRNPIEREVLLFDGTSMEGWRGYNRETLPDGWAAVDGMLTRTTGGGDIVYGAKQYQDFDLRMEWKIEEGGNSGI